MVARCLQAKQDDQRLLFCAMQTNGEPEFLLGVCHLLCSRSIPSKPSQLTWVSEIGNPYHSKSISFKSLIGYRKHRLSVLGSFQLQCSAAKAWLDAGQCEAKG